MFLPEKTEVVREFGERIQGATLIALTDYRTVNVAQVTTFRRRMRDAGLTYRVVKNSLATRAISGTPMEALGKHLTGMTGWIISNGDPIAAARALRDAVKDLHKVEKLTFKAGYFDGTVVDAATVKAVADLPGKDELRSALLATIQEAPRLVLSAIQAPARDLLYLLNNYAETRPE